MEFYLLHLKNCPIFSQLEIEEALLRTDSRNFCIVNEGSTKAIVMGISGKLEELVDHEKALTDGIPIIKRFSGGGTVIVDESTLFVTFICHKDRHDFPLFPEKIMKWSEEIYRPVFDDNRFNLKENDYVFGTKKFGGNAQYIKKDRFLHHTSFLWDYDPLNMDYLLQPKKAPAYRDGRSHLDFICKMKEFYPSKELFKERLFLTLNKLYGLKEIDLAEVTPLLQGDFRKTTHYIS